MLLVILASQLLFNRSVITLAQVLMFSLIYILLSRKTTIYMGLGPNWILKSWLGRLSLMGNQLHQFLLYVEFNIWLISMSNNLTRFKKMFNNLTKTEWKKQIIFHFFGKMGFSVIFCQIHLKILKYDLNFILEFLK